MIIGRQEFSYKGLNGYSIMAQTIKQINIEEERIDKKPNPTEEERNRKVD
jgi:hypothetical protein